MKVKRIVVTDYKGIGRVEIAPGALTVVAGQNGSGKSSVLDAIRDVFDGGHHPECIRKGAKRAVVEIEFDGGQSVVKTVTPKTTTLAVKDDAGNDVKSPQGYIASLASGIAFDPLSFLTRKPKERVAFLLSVAPIHVTPAEIVEAAGFAGPSDLRYAWTMEAIGLPPSASLGVAELDALRDRLYQSRTRHNVLGKEADSTANSLRRALPDGAESGKDWASEAVRIEGEIDAINADLAEKNRTAANTSQAKQDALREERDEKIRQIRAEYDAAIGREKDALIEEQARLAAEAAPYLYECRDSLGAAKQNAANAARVEALREQVTDAERRAREDLMAAERLTDAIKAIDEVKRKKMQALPVEGMTIQDGEIYVDGVPFDSVNTARRYLIACQLASMAVGPLGLMVADGAEALDEKNWAEFCDAVAQSDLQLIVARVTDEEALAVRVV